MNLSLIAAHDPNLVIGHKGVLPWHYKEDMLHFKRTTMGKPVLMGRGVFEEIGEKPLPGRRNVVLTRTRNYPENEIEVCRTIDEALELLRNEEEVFVIGGGEIYKQTIDIADRLYITEIHNEYRGDTFFPEYRHLIGKKWQEISRENYQDFSFILYKKSE